VARDLSQRAIKVSELRALALDLGSRRPAAPAHFRAGDRVLEVTECFDAYWRFAAERQRIFHLRASGTPPPWTADPILARHEFTSVYRATDRVSQYLIREVIYTGPQDPPELVFRILLFKLFNKIETWELLGERRYAEANPRVYAITGPSVVPDFRREDGDDPVRRRELLAGAAGLASAAFLAPTAQAQSEPCPRFGDLLYGRPAEPIPFPALRAALTANREEYQTAHYTRLAAGLRSDVSWYESQRPIGAAELEPPVPALLQSQACVVEFTEAYRQLAAFVPDESKTAVLPAAEPAPQRELAFHPVTGGLADELLGLTSPSTPWTATPSLPTTSPGPRPPIDNSYLTLPVP
jgi:hypothetical protein